MRADVDEVLERFKDWQPTTGDDQITVTLLLDLASHLRAARADSERFEVRMDGMRQAVRFYRSVILSGEEWSATCESVYQAATSGEAIDAAISAAKEPTQ